MNVAWVRCVLSLRFGLRLGGPRGDLDVLIQRPKNRNKFTSLLKMLKLHHVVDILLDCPRSYVQIMSFYVIGSKIDVDG